MSFMPMLKRTAWEAKYEQPRFHGNAWNVRFRTKGGIPRTNSACQVMFDGSHPNMWSFIWGLQREASFQFGQLTKAGQDPPRQKKAVAKVNI